MRVGDLVGGHVHRFDPSDLGKEFEQDLFRADRVEISNVYRRLLVPVFDVGETGHDERLILFVTVQQLSMLMCMYICVCMRA